MIVGDMEIRLRADIARLQRDMTAARETVTSATNGMARAADAAKSALAGIGLGMGLAQVIQMSDQYTKFTAQLRLATLSSREYGQALASVKAISTNAQASMGELGTLYARIANGTRELGTTQKQVANITETVALALKVSGATAQESSSAMLQLSQSFASGTLRGEEFNAVNEAAPRLMLALADGIGVPVGALKAMATNGLITSQIMADVLPKALGKLRTEAKEIQTISGAFQVLKDRVMEVTAVRAKDNGSVAALTQGIGLLANNLNGLLTVMTGLTVIKAATWAAEWVTATYARITANQALTASAVESTAAELRRATADRNAALIAQSRAREAVAAARVEVAADQQRMASAAAAAEAAIAARLAQFTETRVIVMAEIELEKVRLAAQINSIGRTQRLAELARLSTQVVAINAGMAASSTELAAVRIANEAAAANAAALGSAKIAAAREAEVLATGGAAAATLRMRLATAATTGAMAAASVGAGILRGALALLGGPIGAIITVLTLGGLAWMTWGNKAKEGNDKALDSMEETGAEMIVRLNKQIEKLQERNALAATEPRIKKITDLSDADRDGLARSMAKRDKEIASQKSFVGRSEYARTAAIAEASEEYETQLRLIAKAQDEATKAAKRGQDAKTAKWLGENGTAAQKLAFDLANTKKEVGELTPEMEKLIRAKYVDKGAAAGIKKEESAYASLISAIQTKTEENRLELSIGENASESQKMSIKLDQELASGKLKLSDAHKATARSALDEMGATEKLIKEQTAQREVTKYIAEGAIARQESVDALDVEYQAYGKNADAREMLMVSVKAEADMQNQKRKLEESNLPLSDATIARLENERDARVAVETATLGQTKALQYAAQLATENKQYAADSISDPRARAMALLQIDVDLWQERIKNAGAGTDAEKKLQTEYDTWYANRLKGATVAVDVTQATQLLDIMAALDDAAQSAAQGMANSFGQVGTAIGGLTTALSGYGRTQAAIAAQLADATQKAGADPVKLERAKAAAAQQSAQAQMKSYGDMAGAAKGFFKQNSAGYKVMEGTEKAYRAVEMAMAIDNMIVKSGLISGYTGLFVAAKATETVVETGATAGSVANAGVQASAWGITAVVKSLASLPFPFNLAAGAATLAAVLAIGASMMGGVGGGASVSVSEQRQAAQGTGSVLGDSSAKSESIANSLEILEKNSDSDLNYTRGMLAALRAIQTSIGGLGSQLVQSGLTGAYTDVASTGFFAKLGNSIFGGDTTVTDKGITANKITLSGALSGAWSAKQYTDTKTDGGWFHSDKNNTSTTGLGAAADMQFAKVIQNLAGGITEAAKLLGAGGDAFTQRLNSFVIDIGKVSLKGMTGDEIQKALEAVFSKLGDDMAQFAVGGLAQFQQVGEGYLETLTRVATDYATLDASLQSIGMTFGATGIASIAAREDLISMAGGISNLSDKMSSFSDHFLTEAEQLAPITKYVTEQMTALGYASVDTRDEFKALVLSLNPADQASRTLFNSLLDLESAFDKAHAAGADLAKSESEIASERADLQKQIDQLTLTTVQQRAKERLGISAVNLAMFDMITNLQTIADTSSTLKTSIDSLKAFRDGILSFKDSLTLGSLSTLTPMQKAIEAQRQYQEMLAKANGGDTTAQAGIQAAATAYLTANQVINASSSAYVAASAQVQSDLAGLAAIAGTQLTDAQQQLAAYDKQLSELSALNTTASNIEAALTMPTPTINWSEVGTVNMAPLTEEIKGLRADNEDLRTDNAALLAAIQDQTAAVVQATLTAAANNAAAVTTGAAQTAAGQSWKAQMMAEANA